MNKFFDFRHVVGLFILRRDEKGSRAQELQVFLAHLFFHEVLIDDHHNSEESLRKHLESEM